jgi:hypothetical protein
MTTFSPEIQTAVLAHMNGDHPEDNLLIVRAYADRAITAATMIAFDGIGGTWSVTTESGDSDVTVAWPGGPISERAEVRREVVALYDGACERLGVEPRPH